MFKAVDKRAVRTIQTGEAERSWLLLHGHRKHPSRISESQQKSFYGHPA